MHDKLINDKDSDFVILFQRSVHFFFSKDADLSELSVEDLFSKYDSTVSFGQTFTST